MPRRGFVMNIYEQIVRELAGMDHEHLVYDRCPFCGGFRPHESYEATKYKPDCLRLVEVHLFGYTRSSSERAYSSGGCCDRLRAIDWATMPASSPTPNSIEDLRLRRKWTPQKNR